MIPDAVYKLCRCPESVSSELARNPTEAPWKIAKQLYGPTGESSTGNARATTTDYTPEDLNRAFECGQWGPTRPSDLFLKIYHDVLQTYETDPLIGVCSPSLGGSHGVCPVAIISTIPDIARHMANIIVKAEHEVVLATNYWMHSEPSRMISNALRELSRRSVENGRQAVVKVIYDRGNVKQVMKNHQMVPESEFSDPNGPIQLPRSDELPNVDLKVVNYHRPMLGTFHAKFMVVDRRIAIVQSDNIQDNDNLEICVQLEGPIVDSIYDTALITCNDALDPPLPRLASPAASAPPPTFELGNYGSLFDKEGSLINSYHGSSVLNGLVNLNEAVADASKLDLATLTSDTPVYDSDVGSEMLRSIATMNPINGERRIDGVSRHLNTMPTNTTKATAPDTIEAPDIMTPLIPLPIHDPVPMAMVSRPPFGTPNNSSLRVPQNIAWISALRNAQRSILIQTPDLNAQDLLAELAACARRGVKLSIVTCLGYNDAGELLPLQGGHNEGVAHRLYGMLEQEFYGNLDVFAYVAKDQVAPIHNSFKKRSCHVKLMVVDEHIGIVGSGNQDSQSWYHSQEINVMVDSGLVVGMWLEGIRRNQNTFKYGLVRKGDPSLDPLVGCWVDEKGEMAPGAMGSNAGRFSWLQGVKGAVQRVRGEGGF